MLSVRMTVNKMPGEREVVDKNDFFAGRIVLNKRTYPQKRLPKVFSFPRTVFFFPTVDKFFVSFKNFQHFFKGRLSSNKFPKIFLKKYWTNSKTYAIINELSVISHRTKETA